MVNAAIDALQASLQQAVAHYQRGELALAADLYRAILTEAPAHYDALHLLGILEYQRGRHEAAAHLMRRAIEANPKAAAPHSNLGAVLDALGRPEDALASYDRALALKPDYAAALNNRGNVLRQLKRYEEALASFDRALELKPDYAHALSNRGNALRDLHRFEDALASYARALELKPGYAEALNNRAHVLRELGRHEAAAQAFEQLLLLAPEHDYAAGAWLYCLLNCCSWEDFERRTARVASAVTNGKKAASPFSFLAMSHSAAAQLRCARTYIGDKYPADPNPMWTGERYRHDRIRVAYLSGNFHQHSQATLIAGLFEAHDKARFDITAISYGPDVQDDMRKRLQRAFDRFEDARRMSDREIAQMLRTQEIDIAVDLKGLGHDCRPGIFAHRAAPVQIALLGYPGTSGADYIDYILADRHVIPAEHEAFYAEKVVRLPDTYQVNDSKRAIAERTPARSEVGLPSTGFVFCCFNNNYKLTPHVFDIWMRLLARVEGSVLWLLEDNAAASRNLRQEAAQRGIAPERLVFAPRLPLPVHLARHRLADLFLDTLPCNAHTTAGDALWAGLPVVTCLGGAFAARVAGSLLHAVGLHDLVTQTLEDYEALALKLATMPAVLARMKARLERSRMTDPLFDTDRFRRHIESAYVTMWERYQRGEPPASFAVAPIE